MIIGYCRALKSASRNAQMQLLRAIGVDRVFCDKIGVFGAKPGLAQAIACCRKGDVLAITNSYRVAYSTRGVLRLARELGIKGIGLRILDTPIDTTTVTGRMVLGSAPAWSLGISPIGSALRSFTTGSRRRH